MVTLFVQCVAVQAQSSGSLSKEHKWVEDNVYGGMKFDADYFKAKLGKYEYLDVPGEPNKNAVGYYYTDCGVTLIVDIVKAKVMRFHYDEKSSAELLAEKQKELEADSGDNLGWEEEDPWPKERRWISDHVYQGMVFDEKLFKDNVGNYEMLIIPNVDPEVERVYYFPNADVGVIVRMGDLKIQTWELGRPGFKKFF